MDLVHDAGDSAGISFSDVVTNRLELAEIALRPVDPHSPYAAPNLFRTAAIPASEAKLPLSAS